MYKNTVCSSLVGPLKICSNLENLFQAHQGHFCHTAVEK